MALTQHRTKVIIRGLKRFKSEIISISELKDKIGKHDYNLIDEMACLSANVYELKENKLFKDLPWVQMNVQASLQVPFYKYKVPGLKYEVWKKKLPNDNTLVAIVFRGTVSFWDWYTNFRWFTRFNPFTFDHYDQMKSLIDQIIQEIHDKLGKNNIEIITAGHSLGGGLAQFTAYATPHIKKVVAYDPSPVTGFYSVKRSKRKQNKKGITVYRIFEHGEVLAYARLFKRLIYPLSLKNPHTIQLRYNFLKGNSAYQHNMAKLAEKLKGVKKELNE